MKRPTVALNDDAGALKLNPYFLSDLPDILCGSSDVASYRLYQTCPIQHFPRGYVYLFADDMPGSGKFQSGL